MFDYIIVGGGAAGFFSAINLAEKNKNLKIAILERNNDFLQKVKISGGGRCNVTHACFEPEKLVEFYPRGKEYLLEPFKRFNPQHTIEWFEKRGVILKTEKDKRIFPISDNSQTILDCFVNAAYNAKIQLFRRKKVENISKELDFWQVQCIGDEILNTKNLVLTTGSDPLFWRVLKSFDVPIIGAVPSLFTFNIKDKLLNDLQGISFENAKVKVKNLPIYTTGSMLITHWGLSGPAILKLSAIGAREFADKNYQFDIEVNFLGDVEVQKLREKLQQNIQQMPKKNVLANPEFGLSHRFWKAICEEIGIAEFQKWAETGKKHINAFVEVLTKKTFKVDGKSTFKDEFVTAGGVDLEAIDLTKFCLKNEPSLFLAGEILNIDALTGGFNFQAAWTGAWIISEAIGRKKF